MKCIKRTTPEEEQREKDEAFFQLTPKKRLELMRRVRERWRDPDINYQLEGSVVTVKRKGDL